MSMQSYECVIISKMFLIYFISYGCNDSALVFLGGAEASASPSFALPMFITIKKIIILHLFLGVPAATVGGTGTPWHTRGYAPDICWPSNTSNSAKSGRAYVPWYNQVMYYAMLCYSIWVIGNQLFTHISHCLVTHIIHCLPTFFTV